MIKYALLVSLLLNLLNATPNDDLHWMKNLTSKEQAYCIYIIQDKLNRKVHKLKEPTTEQELYKNLSIIAHGNHIITLFITKDKKLRNKHKYMTNIMQGMAINMRNYKRDYKKSYILAKQFFSYIANKYNMNDKDYKIILKKYNNKLIKIVDNLMIVAKNAYKISNKGSSQNE